MTIEQFGNATHCAQKTMVKFHGSFLLQKTVGIHTCKLFALDDFYVEINYCFLPYSTPLLQSLTLEEIDDYLCLIDLADVHSSLGAAP